MRNFRFFKPALALALFAAGSTPLLAAGDAPCSPNLQWSSASAVAQRPNAADVLVPVNVRVDGLAGEDAVVAPEKDARVTWELSTNLPAARGIKQAEWRVLVSEATGKTPRLVFEIKSTAGDAASQECIIPAGKLAPDKNYTVAISVRPAGSRADYYATGSTQFRTGPASSAWASARWIGHKENAAHHGDAHPSRRALWIRKDFTLPAAAGSAPALVHVASFGYHELFVNGKRVGDTVLEPAVSNLALRVFYRTYDISRYLHEGANTIGVWLGHGWTGYGDWLNIKKHGFHTMRTAHGPAFKLLYPAAGIVSDASWHARPSPLTKTGPWSYFNFGGETWDARADAALVAGNAWASPAVKIETAGTAGNQWLAAAVVDNEANAAVAIEPQPVEPNRVVRVLRPVGIEKVGEKKWRVDFGEVVNGWLEIPLTGSAGTVVTLRYTDRSPAEGDEWHGIKNKWAPESYSQVDRVTLAGDAAADVFQNRFNYRTFRWLTVEGIEPPADTAAFTAGTAAKLIRSDYARAAKFESAESLFAQIHRVVSHTYECLTLGGYIVDCSHRERLGYGAEGQASMEAGLFNFDQNAFFRKWLGDWRDVLMSDGRMPNTAPTTWGGGGPAWKIVCATLPWQHYLHYGDKRVLAENYAMLTAHLAMLEDRISKNPAKVVPVFSRDMWHYIGDWYDALGIDPPAKGRGINFDTRQFFSNCFVVYGFQHAADIAGVLGKDADAARYQKLADDLRAAVHKAFYDAKNGCYAGCKEQTHLSAPLFTGVTPPAERERLQSALVENIKQTRSGHLTSGVLGTYLQLKHLTASRLDDLVAGAFKKRDYPSYGYFFDNGLTAVPEAWDISSGSRCHTSFLSGGAWFINGLAGIQPDPAAPAFKHFFVRPGAVRSTEWVKVEHSSIRGKICVAWRNVKKKFFLDVTIPPNSTATVRLPAPETSTVYEGDEPLTTRTGGLIKLQTSQSTGADAYLDVTLESGSYHFEVR